jgi:hypothetical protein
MKVLLPAAIAGRHSLYPYPCLDAVFAQKATWKQFSANGSNRGGTFW